MDDSVEIQVARAKVLGAAIQWRRRVSIAQPVGQAPPTFSTRLAEAVDAYLALVDG